MNRDVGEVVVYGQRKSMQEENPQFYSHSTEDAWTNVDKMRALLGLRKMVSNSVY